VVTLLAAAANAAAASRLAYATFLPGNSGFFNNNDVALLPRAVADAAGNTYVADARLRFTPMPYGGSQPEFDSFVMKVSADGKNIVFTTHLEGQIPTGLALDAAGYIYVVGQSGPSAGFIAKMAPDGSTLYITQIHALPLAVATDAAGAVYVTGTARADFRTTPGAYKTSIGPAKCTDPASQAAAACTDAFVAKFRSDDASLVYATLLGGTGDDSGLAIVVDQDGSAVVVGHTLSPDFPASQGAYQPAYGGGAPIGGRAFGDGFAARLDPAGRTLVYATFAGGSNGDRATGVAWIRTETRISRAQQHRPTFRLPPAHFSRRSGACGICSSSN
jgi:DNA-binding beta-propeller fold protein YncE